MKKTENFEAFFNKHKNHVLDIKCQGMKSRKGLIKAAFPDFVLIDFEHESPFCPEGLFYICYSHIVDFAISEVQFNGA